MKPAALHHLIEHHAGALIFGILFVSMLGGVLFLGGTLLMAYNFSMTVFGNGSGARR